MTCDLQLVGGLEDIVREFDSEVYAAEHPADPTDGNLLASFRRDMKDSMSAFQSCRAKTNLERISCMSAWWRGVVDMQQTYASLDASSLTGTDAYLVKLLKQMLTLESYIPGTNPTVTFKNFNDAVPTSLSELVEEALRRNGEEDGPVQSLKRVVSSLREFVNRINIFGRLRGNKNAETLNTKRKLLTVNEGTGVLAGYQADLEKLLQIIDSIRQRRTKLSSSTKKERLMDILHFFLQSSQGKFDLASERLESRIRSEFKERIFQAIRKRIAGDVGTVSDTRRTRIRDLMKDYFSQSGRKLLMQSGVVEPFTVNEFSDSETEDAHLTDLQNAFKHKASTSLQDLGDLNAAVTRKLLQSTPDTGMELLKDIRPHVESVIDTLESTEAQAHRDVSIEDAWKTLEQKLTTHEITNPSLKAALEFIRRAVTQAGSEHVLDGDDLENERAKLDDLLHTYLSQGWDNIMEDANNEMGKVLKASTAIIAHDAHYHASSDHGLPDENITLEALPDGSTEILSEVCAYLKRRI